MKKIVLLIVIVLTGGLLWWWLSNRTKPKEASAKLTPATVSRYSPAFVASVNNALTSYYALSDALVKWDGAAVKNNAMQLSTALDSINFAEVKGDTVIYETATSYVSTFHNDLETIAGDQDITGKRRAFHSFSQNFYDLLRAVRYDAAKVYLEECPMAFNDTETGLWLSPTDSIRNPYLGLYHPKYKSSMLECGAVRDTLNFKGNDSK